MLEPTAIVKRGAKYCRFKEDNTYNDMLITTKEILTWSKEGRNIRDPFEVLIFVNEIESWVKEDDLYFYPDLFPN